MVYDVVFYESRESAVSVLYLEGQMYFFSVGQF